MEFKQGLNQKKYLEFKVGIKIHPDAVLGADSKVGDNTIINNCILGVVEIGGDCILGNFTILEDGVVLGDGSKVWHYSHIRNNVEIGKDCILGNYVYIDSGVKIGDGTKIQNYVPVYQGVEVSEGVFLGPNSLTTNDMFPKARTESGDVKGKDDWKVSAICIGKDASIGAGAILRPGITIGERALVGAGAMVTRDVPAGAVVVGNPSKITRYVKGYGSK